MTGRVIIGIDPGLSGGIAVITPSAYTVHDVPTLEIKAGKKIRHRYNVALISTILRAVLHEATKEFRACEAWLEDVHSFPGQGVASMFSMGRGLGMYEGIVTALGIPLNYVSPVTWKKKMMDGQGKEKDAAVYKAQQLFPAAQLVTSRGRLLDGRAEALLIASYGKRQMVF